MWWLNLSCFYELCDGLGALSGLGFCIELQMTSILCWFYNIHVSYFSWPILCIIQLYLLLSCPCTVRWNSRTIDQKTFLMNVNFTQFTQKPYRPWRHTYFLHPSQISSSCVGLIDWFINTMCDQLDWMLDRLNRLMEISLQRPGLIFVFLEIWNSCFSLLF